MQQMAICFIFGTLSPNAILAIQPLIKEGGVVPKLSCYLHILVKISWYSTPITGVSSITAKTLMFGEK